MKKKIFSLSILIILFLTSLFLGKLYFAVCMCIFGALALRELLNIKAKDNKYPIEIEILSYIMVVFFVMNNFDGKYDYYFLDYRLISSLIFVSLIPIVFIRDKSKYNLVNALYMMGSTLFIGTTFNLIVQLRSYNLDYVTYIFLIALFTDLFSYITGTLIGSHKIVSISSKKTFEGLIGGLIMGTFVPSLFFLSTIANGEPVYVVVLITFMLSLLGQLGDLVFTCIKNEFGKKDFSNLVVGNGGILDTIDSLIFITLGVILFMSIL